MLGLQGSLGLIRLGRNTDRFNLSEPINADDMVVSTCRAIALDLFKHNIGLLLVCYNDILTQEKQHHSHLHL